MATAFLGPQDRPRLHLALLGLTVLSTTVTFYVLFGPERWVWVPAHVQEALAFGLSLVLILGSHEMGHYVLARLHGVDTSLPYFIPLPMLGFGTLGAVIRIRGRIPHRNALVDIGAAGPLAGLLVALPLLFWGMAHSQLVAVPEAEAPLFGGSGSLWALAGWVAERLSHWSAGGDVLPEGTAGGPIRLIFGDNLLLWLVRHLTFGPLPPGQDVVPHPTVVAAWVGLLVTMLNLVPIGQLDGGHLTYALWGERARGVGRLAALGLLGLCLFASVGWLVWLVVTVGLVGFRHPPVVLPEVPLSPGRKLVCAVCLLVLVACLMPVPLREVAP
jgi:membrane-associated protease RseP (regulator of RpoE activity)